MISILDSETCQCRSSVLLIGVTHLSKTHTLPPFVGLLNPSTVQSSAPNSYFDVSSSDTQAGVSVTGIDLHIDSTWFSVGTGPLFSFGLAEEQWLLEALHSLRMETALVGSSLANVTNRRLERRKNILFGGDVSQRVVGSEVGRSINHDSGTAMMDGNLGGNVNCVNTSFWECMHEGNDDPSFTNENITDSHPIGRQEFNATSTATLISYSLCTFKNMYSTANRRGGAAILVNGTAASLSAKDCFLRRCQVNADHFEGGAICVWGIADSAQYFELRQCSFSECYSKGTYVSTGGCISLIFTSVTITDSFFEKGQAQYDGALTLSNGTHSTLSNCAFVLCSASDRGGAVGVYYDATVSFSFVQFRECRSPSAWSGQDVFFYTLKLAQVSEGVFKHCDSTSGAKNVYCISDNAFDNSLITPIESVPTLSNVDIQFDEEQMLAVVCVTTTEEIGGTMGVLLNDLNVPRLVHVVFGTETKPSTTGTAVVSSGPNGILPVAEYTPLNYSLCSALFPPPTVLNCVCSLSDANTSLVVVSGICLVEGDYLMKVKKGQDGEEKEISLAWVNSRALQGTAILYPSTNEGRLEWDSEYEVTSVVRTQSEDVPISTAGTIKFTTPKEPIRIEGADCSLGGKKEKAGVVEFWGVGLSSGKEYTLKVQKEEGGVGTGNVIELEGMFSSESEAGSRFHSEAIFEETTPCLSFGETYLVVGVVVGGEEGAVNLNVGFSVPSEPSRLTKITASAFTDAEKTQIKLSFEGRALKASTSYEMILKSIVGEGETGHEKTLVLTTDVDGERRNKKETTDTSFLTPPEPTRIEDCVSAQLDKDRTKLALILTGRRLTSHQVSICLRDESQEWLPLSPITIENDTHCLVVFEVGKEQDASTLAYGKEYTLQQDGESTYCVVMSDIVISVPNPPSLREIKFSFSNNLNTSCVVEVCGSDLVASTEYNLTLNASLWMIIRFSSSTKGKSDELQIGWGEGLEFETEYTVTSIKPIREKDGDLEESGTLSGKTGKRPSSFNIFTDSSSSEGSPFCGDLERACSSISEVWKIMSGLSILRPTIEIVDSVTMSEGIRIVGGMHVVIRNGTSSEPSLIVPSSFSLHSLSAVIVVEATGFLELRNVDVSLESSDQSFVFLSATQATIILREGSITGLATLPPTQNEEESEDVCSWTSGILQLDDCTTTISRQDFTHLSQGAVNMKGGSFKVETSLFHDNTPAESSFPALRHNVFCSGNGTVDVGSMAEGDGYDGSSGWFSTSGCSVSGLASLVVSPFFVPSLSNSSTSSFDTKKEHFEIEVKGSTLIPCGLILEVFEMTKDKKEGTPTRSLLNQNTTTSFTETSIKLSLPSSSLSSLKPELEWRGRLIFGEERRTNTTFIIQQSKTDKFAQSVKDNMKWWLPLVIVMAVALLVLILLIIVCLWRRKKNEKKEDSTHLMSVQEMDVEKDEVGDEDGDRETAHVSSVRGLNGNTVNVVQWTDGQSIPETKEEGKEGQEIASENRVYGLSCGEKEGVVEVVDKTETLYRRLHVLKLGVNRRWAQMSVARGLLHAMRMSEYSAILTELTSHSVVLSGERKMNLILKTDFPQPDPLSDHPSQQTQQQPPQIACPDPLRQSEVHQDDLRWKAPEEGEEREERNQKTERGVGKEFDRTKASVFRLGLVLWEIETGLVPFAEQDGVNAHRNMSIGIVPKMNGVGEKMKGLIEECLSVNPEERPSVESIISRLSSTDEKESTQKAQQVTLS